MTSVREIKGVGEKTQQLLEKLHIRTVEDLLHHYPRCYTTYPEPICLADMKAGERCSVECELVSSVTMRALRRTKLVTCTGADSTGRVFLRWFNMPYLRNTLKQGARYIFTGIPVFRDGRLVLEQPEINSRDKYRKLAETFQPVYPLTAGLSNSTLRKAMEAAFVICRTEEFLPGNLADYYNLMEESRALAEIHFPTGIRSLEEAKKRIIFDEFFLFFSALELVKERENQALNHFVIPMDDAVRPFLDHLPFSLTDAQERVLREIRNDLSGTMAMNRLVQGDVGSGKTIIAMTAMLAAVKAGYQAALMAPTEVLALQHYETFRRMLEGEGVRVSLLMGSMKASGKKTVKRDLQSGETDIIIGTHALIQEGVSFKNLALVVTDEQHRFGVKQRDALSKKGEEPHVLVMSATPIPRTLGMILYRDLDVSVVDQVPASRLPVKNCVVRQEARAAAWGFIRKEVLAGHQAYVICPMIEESESMDVENVTHYSTVLARNLPPEIRVESLNGKMSPEQKNDIMDRFASNEIQVLVSTTVVEVGIDVPNATVMVIENADRFGLAQLHQLRGRVGRGKAQSYCVFISGSDQDEAIQRLSIVGRSNDGFFIAGEDLKLRGPGQFFGTRQSGTLDFGLGDIYANADILKMASEAVDHLKNDGFDFMEIHRDSLEDSLHFARNL